MPPRLATGVLLAVLGACAAPRAAAPTPPPAAAAPDPRPIVYVGGYSGKIARFRLDLRAGTLAAIGVDPGGSKPSFLAFGRDGKHVYAVDQLPDRQGRVVAYSVDRASGALARLGEESSAGVGPAHVSLDRTGRWVLVANYAGGAAGTVAVLPVLPDGGVGAPVDSEDFGVDAKPHFIIADPANRFVLVPCLGLDAVAQLRFDEKTGRIERNQPDRAATAPGAGPRHLALSPDGRHAYGINESNSTMTAYRYDAARGVLEPSQTLSTLPEGWTGKNSGAHVEVHPSGRWLFGSNRGHDSIAVFALDPDTGRMTAAGHETSTIKTPRNFHVMPGGELLLVASQAADTVSVFRIDAASGALSLVGSPTPVPEKPSFVGMPDLGMPALGMPDSRAPAAPGGVRQTPSRPPATAE